MKIYMNFYKIKKFMFFNLDNLDLSFIIIDFIVKYLKSCSAIEGGISDMNGNPNITYTQKEADDLVEQLSKAFSVVRILKDREVAGFQKINSNGLTCRCFEFWGKHKACENCISYKVLHDRSDRVKFEYLDGKAYQVISEYINVDGTDCVLEILKEFDKVTMDAEDARILSKKLFHLNSALYLEPLTGCRNRMYYEDYKDTPLLDAGVAFLDVDYFKSVNDLYGHMFGDEVLKGIVQVFLDNTRDTDAVIRYGGDEFLIVIPNIDTEVFEKKLEKILTEVNSLGFYMNPDYHASISIGALVCKEKKLYEATDAADKLMFQAKKKKNCIVKGW